MPCIGTNFDVVDREFLDEEFSRSDILSRSVVKTSYSLGLALQTANFWGSNFHAGDLGPPSPQRCLVRVRLLVRVAEQLQRAAPWGVAIDEPIARPGFRPRQRLRFGKHAAAGVDH